eukprot:10129912-Heterocapsa_arctica.AAC.1
MAITRWCEFMYNLCWMIRDTQLTPLQWSASVPCPLPKHNGKDACAALRLVHLLEEPGKCWNDSLWRQFSHNWHMFSYGFIPHKR